VTELKDTNKKPAILIGLYGNKAVGKDTVGSILGNTHSFYEFSFAKHLYECVAQLFHVRVEALKMREHKESPMKALYGMSPRDALKLFASSFVRDMICPTFWIDEVDRRIQDTTRSKRETIRAVITDCAMLNEIKYVLDNGGYVLYIERPGCDERRVREDEYSTAETFIQTLMMEDSPYVVRVKNDGNIKELEERVNSVIQYIALNSFNTPI
jgi:hypothetical protein